MPDRVEDGLLHAFVLDGAGGGLAIGWDGGLAWKPGDGIRWGHLDYAEGRSQKGRGEESGRDAMCGDALLGPEPRPRAPGQEGEKLLLLVRGVNRADTAHPEHLVSLRCWFEPRRMITMRHRVGKVVKPIAEKVARGTGPKTIGDFVT